MQIDWFTYLARPSDISGLATAELVLQACQQYVGHIIICITSGCNDAGQLVNLEACACIQALYDVHGRALAPLGKPLIAAAAVLLTHPKHKVCLLESSISLNTCLCLMKPKNASQFSGVFQRQCLAHGTITDQADGKFTPRHVIWDWIYLSCRTSRTHIAREPPMLYDWMHAFSHLQHTNCCLWTRQCCAATWASYQFSCCISLSPCSGHLLPSKQASGPAAWQTVMTSLRTLYCICQRWLPVSLKSTHPNLHSRW